jgi:uncharacterized repeat protein (TIGR01451 family)
MMREAFRLPSALSPILALLLMAASVAPAAAGEATLGETSADLAVVLTATPDPVPAGGLLTYTATVTNLGPGAAANAQLTVQMAEATYPQAVPTVAGWTCFTSLFRFTTFLICIANGPLPPGSTVFTWEVSTYLQATTYPLLPEDHITARAMVESPTPDPVAGNDASTATVARIPLASLRAVKSVAGSFVPGTQVTYTIVISNAGTAQPDNPGAELNDVLPATLALVSASATAGVAAADPATNTVSWNGIVPTLGAVTVTIAATVQPGSPAGTLVSNQAAVAFDADGNGSNESTRPSDDPAGAGAADPTVFPVASGPAFAEVPTLDGAGLLALGLLLAAVGGWRLRRG